MITDYGLAVIDLLICMGKNDFPNNIVSMFVCTAIWYSNGTIMSYFLYIGNNWILLLKKTLNYIFQVRCYLFIDGLQHRFDVSLCILFQVIDSVSDYVAYMKEIFDFGAIKCLLQGSDGQPAVNVLINSMHGG